MHAIEIEAPIDLNGNIHLPEPYSYLYGQRARMVILWQSPVPPVEQSTGKSEDDWPAIDPQRDLAAFIGTTGFPEDGVAYQRRIRDEEWP